MIYAYVAAGNTCVLDEPPRDLSAPIDPLSVDKVRAAIESHANTFTVD